MSKKIDDNGQGCLTEDSSVSDFTMVIFGGAGDLSRKKLLPTLYHLFQRGHFSENFKVLGCGGSHEINDIMYREIAEESVKSESGNEFDSVKFDEFSKHLFFFSGRLEEDSSFIKLRELLISLQHKDQSGRIDVVYYMAIPPDIFEIVIQKLGQFSLNKGIFNAKIIVEKPFGHDFESSKELNRFINTVFHENEIYRIDHYLGKETLQNIIFFRFSNSIFEPLWNRRYIDNVQITASEDIGIENRGKFYEKACIVRDIVQNHIMQIIALIAMEPPANFEPEMIRDEKVKVFRSVKYMDPEKVRDYTVRGQYGKGMINGKEVIGYRDEKFVAPDSNTATFFAGIFEINNWRWSGVPFYVRTGKRLSKRMTEIVIEFKQPPLQLFDRECSVLEKSALFLTIQPEETIKLKFGVKSPNSVNRIEPIEMYFSYGDKFNFKPYPPYSRLILDCFKKDLTLFVRQDEIEAMWKIVDPIISEWGKYKCPDYPNYSSGSEGPEAADELIKKFGHKWLTELK
jgi:glucose-6-phosphate 1-dehydrogenase